MIHMLAAFAEFELDIRKDRQREGINKAKARGVYTRKRKLKITKEEVIALRAAGLGASAIAKQKKVDRKTVYRACPDGWGPAPMQH